MATLMQKPLDWFKIDPKQPRKHFSEPELRQLGESLRVKQLQPVLAQPDGTLIAGERRYRAAKLVGLASLEVKIADEQLTESQLRLWQLTENMQREDLTGHEKWMGCAELMMMNPGWEMKDLAEHLKLDPSTVTRILSPSKCIPAWQTALKDGKVGISDCYAASKLPQDQQNGLLALKLSGASRDEIERAGRKTRQAQTQTVRVSRVKVPLASGSTVTVSAEAVSLEEALECLQQAGKAIKKAIDTGLDIKTAQAVWRDVAASG